MHLRPTQARGGTRALAAIRPQARYELPQLSLTIHVCEQVSNSRSNQGKADQETPGSERRPGKAFPGPAGSSLRCSYSSTSPVGSPHSPLPRLHLGRSYLLSLQYGQARRLTPRCVPREVVTGAACALGHSGRVDHRCRGYAQPSWDIMGRGPCLCLLEWYCALVRIVSTASPGLTRLADIVHSSPFLSHRATSEYSVPTLIRDGCRLRACSGLPPSQPPLVAPPRVFGSDSPSKS